MKMQTPNEHIFLLTDLLPRYRFVNTLYREIVDSSILSFDTQCSITDFYNEFNDILAFEKAILSFLLSTDKEKQMQIISNLRTEVHKNTEIYTANKDFFNEIDIINVCSDRHNPFKIEIEGQLKDTNKRWKELKELRSSLEYASWNNDKLRTQQLFKEEEWLEGLYKKEQQKLDSLYQKQRESDKHASKYLKNLFMPIYELGCFFISLLDNYYPIEKENISVSEPISANAETISKPEQELQVEIEPDTIFKTGKHKKLLLTLEPMLIHDIYLNAELHWVSINKNRKPDIQNLVIFISRLMDNDYFLPRRDIKIREFFEKRYNIKIGQSFEPQKRKKIVANFPLVFHDYPF